MKRNSWLVIGFVLLFSLAAARGSLAEAAPWQPVPGPYGGSVAALALSPNYSTDHTVFAGLRGQGVYRTTDGGASWQRVSPAGWVVVALAISPAYAADRTLLAAAGLPTASYRVYRSADEGATWQDVTPEWSNRPDAPGLVVSPNFAADQTVYVLGGSQTYVSTDGGVTFAAAGGWLSTHQVAGLAFSPAYAQDRTLFALVKDERLHRSTDGGATWNPTGLSGSASTFAISPDYANDRMLIAIGAADGQLHLSTDGGNTWSTGTLILGAAGQRTLLFSPTFATDRLILAASSTDPGPYRSADGGVTWSPVGWYDPQQSYRGGFIGGSVFALALAPQAAYDAAAFAGTSSGIYRSSSWGENWYQSNNGLARLTVRAVAVAPGEPSTLLAGASFFEHLLFDTGTPGEYDGNLQLSTDGGLTWRNVSGRLDRVLRVTFSPGFASDRTAFAATGALGQHGFYNGGVYRSTDGGQNWSPVLSNLICPALALSPNFPKDHTLWVSTFTYSTGQGIQVSTNGGNTWAPLVPAVHAQVLVPSPNYVVDRTLFAGTRDSGLQRSADGGLHWTQVLSYPITALAVSPAYGASQTLYAGVKESPTAPGQVYRSADGGETWQRLETGIPTAVAGNTATISVLAFAADGSVVAGIFYGNEAGGGAVVRSADGGGTWQPLGSGLSETSVFDLATVPAQSLVFYAGASGGLWQIEEPQGGPAEPGTWETNGPRGGKAQALAVSPDFENDGITFSGEWLDSGKGGQSGLGIFKSSDGGQTWQGVAGGTEAVSYSSAVHAFAFSPGFANDRTIFAATWGGLFKSTDGGEHWEWLSRLYAGPPGSIATVVIAPDYPDSGHVLASGSWGGLFVSQDGGSNWTKDYNLTASAAIAYSPGFSRDGTAFAAGYNGLYRTADRGMSWAPVLTQPLSALAVSPQFATDGTLFAGGDALYLSHDGGTSWISATVSLDSPRVNALAISPAFTDDRTLFAGAGGLYRSSDGGTSWQRVTSYPGGPVLSLAMSPGWPKHPVLLVGTAQGVYRTTDGGASWTRAQGMASLSTSPLALSADGKLLVTGTSNHGLYASDDGSASWFPLGLQEGMLYYGIPDMAISPAYASDRTIFAAWASGVSIGAGIYRTTDGGATWKQVYSTDYVGALAISPGYAHDHTIYATGNSGRVLRSTDGGGTWSPLGNWPAGISNAGGQVALPPNYPTDSTILAAGSRGFWQLTPGAATWQPAASGLGADVYVRSFAVSPNYAADKTLLAAGSWSAKPGGTLHYGIFRSSDGGVNWKPASTGLPDVPLRRLAFSPNYAADHTTYATSEDRLYRSLDGGQRWTEVGAPPGSPALSGLAVDSSGNVYVASSLGVWRYTTPAQDIIVNGGFEANSGWTMPVTPRQAGYSDRVVYDGRQSVRVGIDNGSIKYAYSSARQVVTIPADATKATLSFYVYRVSSRPVYGDAQYVLIMDPNTNAILRAVFWNVSNAQQWQHTTFDLMPYAGQTIVVHFGVRNDGAKGRTGMYVDDVSLVVTRPARPTSR